MNDRYSAPKLERLAAIEDSEFRAKLEDEIDAMGCFALSHWDMELLGMMNLTWALAEMMHGVTCVDRINIYRAGPTETRRTMEKENLVVGDRVEWVTGNGNTLSATVTAVPANEWDDEVEVEIYYEDDPDNCDDPGEAWGPGDSYTTVVSASRLTRSEVES